MENLKIKDPTRSREEWMKIVGLPEDLRQNVMAFMVGTMDLYALLKSHLGDKMEICIADEDYEEIELNSRILRLGSFLVVSVALPLFLNLVGNYIYDRLTEPGPVVKEVDVPEYQQPATVSFTITVEDTLGKKKEFQYEGPAADYKIVAAEIQKMWNEE